MEQGVFLQGLLLGLGIAAPVGPIGLLCIQRTLAQGRLSGFVSGLGAATADGIYGLVAALGLGAISSALIGHLGWLRIAGGVLLCGIGLRTLLKRAGEEKPADAPDIGASARRAMTQGVAAFSSTLLLTLANPISILSFAGVMLGLGAVDRGLWLVSGVFCGSALWWLTLSQAVGLVRHRVTPGALGWVSRAAGVVILGYGLAALTGLV